LPLFPRLNPWAVLSNPLSRFCFAERYLSGLKSLDLNVLSFTILEEAQSQRNKPEEGLSETEMIKKSILTAVLFSFALLTPAHSAQLILLFTSGSGGNLDSATASFFSGNNIVNATGYNLSGTSLSSLNCSAGTSPSWTNCLYEKTQQTDPGEDGLGIANDPAGTNEITPTTAIQLDFSTPISKGASTAQLAIGSSQPLSSSSGEGWIVYGSNVAGTLGTQLGSISGACWTVANSFCTAGNDLSVLLNLPIGTGANQYKFFTVTAAVSGGSQDIILNEVTLTPSPEPATYFLAGIALLGLGISRSKK
jgi:hypothetical protein